MRQRATAQTAVSARGGLSIDVQLAAFFASGVKGLWRESKRAGTMFVENTGVTPVSSGSMAGLVLSLDQGGARGTELVTSPSIDGVAQGGPSVTFYATGATVAAAPAVYQIIADVVGYAGTGVVGFSGSQITVSAGQRASNGRISANTSALAAGAISLITQSTNTANFRNISIRQILGNHQSQATAGLRPLYQTGPQRLVFDGVDDVLTTTFASALGASCTVGRAIPGTGAVITTGVNIGTSFADSVTASALLIADRALTAGETALWTAYLNQQAAL